MFCEENYTCRVNAQRYFVWVRINYGNVSYHFSRSAWRPSDFFRGDFQVIPLVVNCCLHHKGCFSRDRITILLCFCGSVPPPHFWRFVWIQTVMSRRKFCRKNMIREKRQSVFTKIGGNGSIVWLCLRNHGWVLPPSHRSLSASGRADHPRGPRAARTAGKWGPLFFRY